MNVQWVLIRSWHIVARKSRGGEASVTLCGRYAPGPTVDVLPNGKSCESCLRIGVRLTDRSEDDPSVQHEAVTA